MIARNGRKRVKEGAAVKGEKLALRAAKNGGERDSAGIQRETRRAHSLERAEDYVETIAELIEQQGEARAVDIARVLGVTHVTVIRTVQRLQREGFVKTLPYRSIFLTEEGSSLAEKARDRHQKVLAFLIALGVPPETAEIDAEGIEHHVSPATLEAFEAFLHSGR